MFYVNVLNTKVVDKFLILVFLKFHDFRPSGLGVIYNFCINHIHIKHHYHHKITSITETGIAAISARMCKQVLHLVH